MESLSAILKNRGLIAQHSGASLDDITTTPRTLYLGFDPTADSLHVGNLVPFMIVRQFVAHGHKAILLVGGGTGMIGDPSGKESERQLLDDITVVHNTEKIAAQVKKIVGSTDIALVNNAEWLSRLSVIEFLRDTGKHFTVNAMMQKDTVKNRINDPDKSISFTEFAYPLLQAFDYYHLNQNNGVTLQVGGNDQWGNIAAGVDFIRRKTGQTVHGITAPLIIDKATGKKFGKSEGNAIWIDREKTSPHAFYQFWINASDESVSDYLKIFTDVSLEEITSLEEGIKSNPGERAAQKKLAFEVTKLIHGEAEAVKAAESAQALFSGTGDLSAAIEAGMPTYAITQADSIEGKSVIDVLVESGLAPSKREARTLIESGAVSLNGIKVGAVDQKITMDDFSESEKILLKKGKRDMVALHVEG